MKAMLCVVLGFLALIAPVAHAQESSTGQGYDAQVNWSALRNQIDQVSTQNKALSMVITKFQACGTQQKLYAPGAPGANSDGCVEAMQKFAGTYMKGAYCNNNFCRFANPITKGCSCPSGYVAVQMWDWSSNDGYYADTQPACLKMVTMYQCVLK